MAGKFETITVDKGETVIRRRLKQVDKSFVTIGIHNDAGTYENGIDVALVAFWNEFGTRKIPARPFIRSAIFNNLETLKKKTDELEVAALLRKKTVKQALDSIGFTMQELIKGRINTASQWAAPISAATKAAKLKGGALRGPVPLINTGLLLRSVTFKSTVS